MELGRLSQMRWHSRQRKEKRSDILGSPGGAGPCAPKKMPRSGLGETRQKTNLSDCSCPPRTGRELAPSDQVTALVRLSWRRRARNPSATLHENRRTP